MDECVKKNNFIVHLNRLSAQVLHLEDLIETASTQETLYPRLYLPRNPVKFVEVSGTMHYANGAEKLYSSCEKTVRFTRLHLASEYNEPGEIMTQHENSTWIALLTLVHSRQRFFIDGYSIDAYSVGLQSGGRSALKFLPDGRLLRIKGAEYESQLQLFDDVPYGSSIEFYTQREIKNYQLLCKRAPKELFAYTPVGWYDYGTDYHGDNMQAGLFIIKGDTRLDEILTTFAAAEYAMVDSQLPAPVQHRFLQQLDEMSFIIGRIAGIRLKQLDQTGIPWSRRTGNSNAHIGNMVLYDQHNKTTIGIVDLDAAGGFMRSIKHKQYVIGAQYSKILMDINEPIHISPALDSPLRNQFYPRNGYSPAAQGFVEGYYHGGSETISTHDLIETIAAVRSIENIIIIERQLIMHGIEKRKKWLNVKTRDYQRWTEEGKFLCEAKGLFPKYKNRKKE